MFTVIRRRITVLVILLALLAAGLPALAQGGGVTQIPVESQAYFFRLAPDGRTVAVFDNTAVFDLVDTPVSPTPVRLLDISTGEETFGLQGPDFASDVQFSPDGSSLAVYYFNGLVYQWDLETREVSGILPGITGNGRLAYLPGGQHLLTIFPGSPILSILQWDLATGQLQQLFTNRFDTFAEFRNLMSQGITAQSLHSMVAFAVLPDAENLLSVSMNGTLWQWDLTDPLADLVILRRGVEEQPRLPIRQLNLTADGSTLVYLDSDTEQIESLDVATGITRVILEDVGRTNATALSPDGEVFAWVPRTDGASVINFIRLSSPADVQTVLLSEGDIPLRLPELQFTPDGTKILVSGATALDTAENVLFVVDVP